MSREVKTQVVWLPDGFGGGEHADVCRAADYDALEAERERLREKLDAAIETCATYKQQSMDARAELAAIKGQEVDGGN